MENEMDILRATEILREFLSKSEAVGSVIAPVHIDRKLDLEVKEAFEKIDVYFLQINALFEKLISVFYQEWEERLCEGVNWDKRIEIAKNLFEEINIRYNNIEQYNAKIIRCAIFKLCSEETTEAANDCCTGIIWSLETINKYIKLRCSKWFGKFCSRNTNVDSLKLDTQLSYNSLRDLMKKTMVLIGIINDTISDEGTQKIESLPEKLEFIEISTNKNEIVYIDWSWRNDPLLSHFIKLSKRRTGYEKL